MADPAEDKTLEDEISEVANDNRSNVVPFPQGNQSGYSQDQLDYLREQQRQQEIQQKFNEIQNKLLNLQQPLTNSERKFIETNLPEEDFGKQILAFDSKLKGKKLNNEEKAYYNQLLSLFSSEGDQSHGRFHQKAKVEKSLGGTKVIHFTDPHLEFEDLETRIKEVLTFQAFDPRDDLVVITGDILPDLMDRKIGLEAFNINRITHKGEFTEEEAAEFEESYREFLRYAGMTFQDIETGGATLGLGAEQIFQRFTSFFYMMDEPKNLSEEELEDFRKRREEVHQYLKLALKRHARSGYKEILQYLEDNDLTSENTIIVPGNHDVESEMRAVLGEYIPNPGEIRDVRGMRIGNLVSGSSGEALGFHLSDDFAWHDVRKDPKTMYNTEAFQELKKHLHSYGLTHIDDFKLGNLIQVAKAKQSLGMADSDLAKYFAAKVKPQMDVTIKRKVDEIPDINPDDVDFFVGHGNPVHPMFAGAEERMVHQKIKGSGKAYLYGHNHENNSKKQDEVYYLNPGTAENYSHGAYIFNKDKELQDILFGQVNPINRKLDFRTLGPDSLSSEDVKYKQAA